MKIGLNATCFNDRPSGAKQRFVGIYRELVKRLPETEFVVYEPVDCRVGRWFEGAPNVSARKTPIHSEARYRKILQAYRYWDKALRPEEFDILELFNLPVVKSPKARIIHTIHDIRALQFPNNGLKRAVCKKIIGHSLRSADHVVTVSAAMKSEISSFFPDTPISVIYNGCPGDYSETLSESDLLAFRKKFAPPEAFILAVGHFEKRKNYAQLIDAIAAIRDRGGARFLVIIGNDSGEKTAIQQRIESSNQSGSVMLLSNLSDLEVRCAYALCSLFVFPSTYEGFGIPILEAMAAGRPMVLTDIPVFREITQDQGVYFRPNDVESMALAIENVLSSNSERARLVDYGIQRVKAFDYKSLAAQMERVYRTLVQFPDE